jgi:hypothetical protein
MQVVADAVTVVVLVDALSVHVSVLLASAVSSTRLRSTYVV